MSETFDLAIIGAGLSGARVLIELIDRLLRNPARADAAIKIALFDRIGEFGRGIPYGSYSERSSMLIETLEATRCPQFSRWLARHPEVLENLADARNACDRDWFARNRQTISSREFSELYLPRHIFGLFSEQALAQRIDAAQRARCIHVTRYACEIDDLHAADDGHYKLFTARESFDARHVVLSVGSIPRHDPFVADLPPSLEHKYVYDKTFCGSFLLQQALDRYAEREAVGAIRLAIVGAAASAIECLYGAVSHPKIAPRLSSITTVSRSGVLPDGLRDPKAAPAKVSAYALNRTSAKDYVEAARTLLASGQLQIIPALVRSLTSSRRELQLSITRSPEARQETICADLVLNCSGAGDLKSTPSRLLRSLAARLETRENDRGFRLREEYTIASWPKVFVAGPLLNQGTLNSHVESISACFRVGEEIGSRLFESMISDARTPRCVGASA